AVRVLERRIHQVVLAKGHPPADLLRHAPDVAAPPQVPRVGGGQLPDAVRSIQARSGALEGAPADVARGDARLAAHLLDQHREAVGVFPGGAAGDPDRQRPPLARARPQRLAGGLQQGHVPEEPRVGDADDVEEPLPLSVVARGDLLVILLDPSQPELGRALLRVALQGAAQPAAGQLDARELREQLRDLFHDPALRRDRAQRVTTSARARGGSACSAAPASNAARGIPHTAQLSLSCARHRPPARLRASRPSLPSSPIPLSTMPAPSERAWDATVVKSTSAEGTCPDREPPATGPTCSGELKPKWNSPAAT